jgi:hypothetical protein
MLLSRSLYSEVLPDGGLSEAFVFKFIVVAVFFSFLCPDVYRLLIVLEFTRNLFGALSACCRVSRGVKGNLMFEVV